MEYVILAAAMIIIGACAITPLLFCSKEENEAAGIMCDN
jgi:hypothetical protein